MRGTRSRRGDETTGSLPIRPNIRLDTLSATICQKRSLAAGLTGGVAPLWCLLAALITAVATGCSWSDGHGTHHLIVGIGFGLISTTNRPGVDVTDVHALGLTAGRAVVGAGWVHQRAVVIDPKLASNVVISIASTPGNLTVKNFAVESAIARTNQTTESKTWR